MNPAQYIKNAQVTSAPPTPELMERLSDPLVLSLLAYIGGKFMAQAETLDIIKKHVFYGKPLTLQTALPPPEGHMAIIRKLANPKMVKLLHGAIGKATEAGEMMHSILAHVFQDEPLDEINIIEEVGDGHWYDAEICAALDVSFEEAWRKNIAKLKARYGAKFNEAAALDRDLVNERATLEA